jgi:hypothetical protein
MTDTPKPSADELLAEIRHTIEIDDNIQYTDFEILDARCKAGDLPEEWKPKLDVNLMWVDDHEKVRAERACFREWIEGQTCGCEEISKMAGQDMMCSRCCVLDDPRSCFPHLDLALEATQSTSDRAYQALEESHARLEAELAIAKAENERLRLDARETRNRVTEALLDWKHRHALPMNHLSPENVMLAALAPPPEQEPKEADREKEYRAADKRVFAALAIMQEEHKTCIMPCAGCAALHEAMKPPYVAFHLGSLPAPDTWFEETPEQEEAP